MEIRTVIDKKRGCGWRKPGGLYLRCDGVGRPCGRFPLALTVCPTCSVGIKPSRSWTWVDPWALFSEVSCKDEPWEPTAARFQSPHSPCESCPVGQQRLREMGRAGLLWIGGSFYPTPEDWMQESRDQGVSRRITAVPKDFEVGKTWVFVAHREVIESDCRDCDGCGWSEGGATLQTNCKPCKGTGQIKKPAIFHAFRPTAIEYVAKDDDEEEKLERLVKRGVTPVRVERDGYQDISDAPVQELPPTPRYQSTWGGRAR